MSPEAKHFLKFLAIFLVLFTAIGVVIVVSGVNSGRPDPPVELVIVDGERGKLYYDGPESGRIEIGEGNAQKWLEDKRMQNATRTVTVIIKSSKQFPLVETMMAEYRSWFPYVGVNFVGKVGKSEPEPAGDNPFIDFRLYALYHGLLILLGIGLARLLRLAWQGERDRIRQAISGHVHLGPDKDAFRQFRESILAFVPCQSRALKGRLAGLGGRLWLCFLADRLLAISSGTGQVVELSPGELQKLYLVEGRSAKSKVLQLETEGGISTLVLQRLDDMVRIVNVLLKQGIVLKYRAEQ